MRQTLKWALIGLTCGSLGAGCFVRVEDAVCGDGVREGGEDCDDGNTRSGDGCSASCFLETTCGDGLLEGREACDDGNNVSGDGCSADCVIEGSCGDGFLDSGEGCDDGNNRGGDGCSADCFVESGGVCGDGFLDPGEECDDGGNVSGDGCSADCAEESAGYLVCNVSGMCGGRDSCVDVVIPAESTSGGLCSHTCANDGECMNANGFTGACYALGSSTTSVCFQRCDSTADCFAQNVCISVTRPDSTLDGICVPNND